MLPDFRVRRRDYLLEISRALSEELDLQTLLARILRISAELLASHAGIIALLDEKSRDWHIDASYGINPSFLKHLEPLIKDISENEDNARNEVLEVSRRLQKIIESASLGMLTSVGLPLLARQRVIGVIFVFRSYRSRFSSEERSLLESFALQAAIAVLNARLFSQVRDQKQYLDAVLESAADGIFLLDPSFHIVRFNKACARLTGFQAEDALGRQHDEVIRFTKREPGLSLSDVNTNEWLLTNPTPHYSEGDLLRRDNSHISVGITYAPIINDDNQLHSIVANIRDISKFREADEMKSTFISTVSHELRTPVALIKGYVSTLRRDDADWDPKTIKQSLAIIEEEADRLSELIDDLLDASRLQSGAPVLNLSAINLEHLGHRLIERFKTQSKIHHFKLVVTDQLPVLIADEERLTQVITNLLSNAVKYAPAGGDVTLSCQCDEQLITTCVTDAGPGIDPEDIPYIFDRFYRSHNAVNKISGTGLGLYLAKAIIEAHDGRIWVDENYQPGARICFSIPINPK